MAHTQLVRETKALQDYLIGHGPFNGVAEELADTLGISHQRLQSVLISVRSADWVEAAGWTVPFVGRGPGPHTYQLVTGEDAEILQESAYYRGGHVIEHLRRVQAETSLGSIDRRTKVGKWMHSVDTALASMIATGELIFDGSGE